MALLKFWCIIFNLTRLHRIMAKLNESNECDEIFHMYKGYN